jgi:MFS family permease
MSLIFCPSVAVVSRRFPHRRGLAIGLTIGGSSIGGVLWPIMLDQLLFRDGVSFGWAIRVVAFTMLPLLAIACLTVVDPSIPSIRQVMPNIEPSSSVAVELGDMVAVEKPKEMANCSVLNNLTFLLLCLGLAIVYLGLFTPFFYVSAYAIDQGMSSSTAFYLISAINASSFIGRVIPGHLADRYGHFNLCTASVLSAGLVGFCWTATSSLPGLAIWCLAYGFASGVSTSPFGDDWIWGNADCEQAVMSLQGACAGKIATREAQGTAVGLVTGSVGIT